jgi:predicted Fe-Mo cluster-binding NifX family protein
MKIFPALPRSFRVSLFLSTLVTAVASSQALLVTDAKADSSDKARVAVGAFEGAKSDEARDAFIAALKKDGSYEITDAEDLKSSAKASAIAQSAKGLGVNVVITGKVGKGGLKVKVLKGADGKLVDEVEIKGAAGKLKGNIAESGASSVASAIDQAKGGDDKKTKKADEEPADAEEPKDEEAPKADADVKASGSTSDAKGGLSPLDITAGLRPLHRTFAFHQTLADVRPNDKYWQLLKYELPLGPALFIDLNWFPLSHIMSGPAEWIGITGGYEKGFATQSIYGEGQVDMQGKSLQQTLKTDMQAFYVGGRFRFPIGQHMLGLTGTYGQHSFILTGDEGPTPLIPDVKYSYVKVGLDGMFRFGDFMAGARVGKRFVSSTGALQTVWFPHVATQSLEAGVTVGYRLVNMLDLVAGFDWLRYAFDFNPVPLRPSYVAGGAVDEYLSGYIAFRFHLPGKGEVAAE